jgi:hypothetical protein
MPTQPPSNNGNLPDEDWVTLSSTIRSQQTYPGQVTFFFNEVLKKETLEKDTDGS